MTPEDITGTEFFVGVRGYDRDQVDSFLADVAATVASLTAEVEALRQREPQAPERDPLEELGANVMTIVRAANESAATITAEAEQHAADLRAEAGSEAEAIRQAARHEADRILEDARVDADRLRATAQHDAEQVRREAEGAVAAAHEEAERVRTAAHAQALDIEAEAERRGRDRALALADEAVARLAETARKQEEVRSRLADTADEIQLALLALGENIVDPSTAIHAAVFES